MFQLKHRRLIDFQTQLEKRFHEYQEQQIEILKMHDNDILRKIYKVHERCVEVENNFTVLSRTNSIQVRDM